LEIKTKKLLEETIDSGEALFYPRVQYLEEKHDVVNHPPHYISGKIEVIDFIEDQNLGFHLGNAIKYICRAGKKVDSDELIDLQKAEWYLKRYIAKLANSRKD